MKKANTRGLELLEEARAKCIAAADALDELSGELEGLTAIKRFDLGLATAASAVSTFLLRNAEIRAHFAGNDGYDGPEYSKDEADERHELDRLRNESDDRDPARPR
jgi:hypothetical protein